MRLALFILSLGLLAWIASRALTQGAASTSAGAAPSQRLEQVRKTAERVESDQAQRVEEALKVRE